MKLTKLDPFHDDYEPVTRWFHPNGWVIFKARRDWDVVRGATGNGPREWFEVHHVHISAHLKRPHVSVKVAFDGDTLRDCRAWCDKNVNPKATGQTP